jgi:uncharacterized protein with HEPN domain
VKPGREADPVLLAHMCNCPDRIHEYTNAERARFDASRLVQDAVIRSLQTLGVDLGAVWLVVEQDLPALAEAVNRMATQLGPHS